MSESLAVLSGVPILTRKFLAFSSAYRLSTCWKRSLSAPSSSTYSYMKSTISSSGGRTEYSWYSSTCPTTTTSTPIRPMVSSTSSYLARRTFPLLVTDKKKSCFSYSKNFPEIFTLCLARLCARGGGVGVAWRGVYSEQLLHVGQTLRDNLLRGVGAVRL